MKNAIVIGATSGIGRSLANKLLEQGYNVGVSGRRIQLCEEFATIYGNRVFTIYHDIKNLEQSHKVLEALFNHFQKVDLVIIASGISELNYDLDWSIEKDVVDTNVNGILKVYQFVFSKFKEQNSGHLVGISSLAGLRGNRHCPSYSASKAFQLNYLEALRCMAKHNKLNITITDVQPGFVNTPMAKGEGLFWVAPVEKASLQILKAIKQKRRKVYITKRWRLFAILMKIVPNRLLKKI